MGVFVISGVLVLGVTGLSPRRLPGLPSDDVCLVWVFTGLDPCCDETCSDSLLVADVLWSELVEGGSVESVETKTIFSALGISSATVSFETTSFPLVKDGSLICAYFNREPEERKKYWLILLLWNMHRSAVTTVQRES